ncbi:response regulator [bacterium]|nr:response regulator [bacterium]
MPGSQTSPLLALAVLLAGACAVAAFLYLRERRRARHCAARVDRRNAEIGRLRQQLLDARRLEAVGILAGGIVNNLNNLLAAMLGSARLASHETGLPAPARQELDRLLKAGNQAADLVHELGDFYRDADQARRPQDLLKVVRDTVKLLQDVVPTTIEVRADLRQVGPVLATRAGVQQTIVSLGSAFVQALGGAGGRVTIRLEEQRLEQPREGAGATLTPGAYARLGFAVEADERGVPLPLECAMLAALCHEIEGQGTLVVSEAVRPDRRACELWFPLIAWRVAAGADTAVTNITRAPSGPVQPESVEPEAPAAAGPPRATILLVDDEEMVAQVLARGLRRLGYRVVTHLDARTALADFSQTPALFDIVITDQIMPHISGVRLAQRIHEVRPDIPVALCTGFRDSFNEQQAREAGVADFILKPTSHRALAAVVDRLVLKRMEGRG